MKVPTMRELQKAAGAVGASVAKHESHPADYIAVWHCRHGTMGRHEFQGPVSYSRARWLVGEHIAALGRMKEAGL